jgi:hypothetical protein
MRCIDGVGLAPISVECPVKRKGRVRCTRFGAQFASHERDGDRGEVYAPFLLHACIQALKHLVRADTGRARVKNMHDSCRRDDHSKGPRRGSITVFILDT